MVTHKLQVFSLEAVLPESNALLHFSRPSAEFAKEQCAPNVPLERLSLYNRVCYELQLSEGTNYREARQYCRGNSGDLAHTLPDPAFSFLVSQLERTADQLKTKLLWIGVQKVPDTQAWNWVNGE